MIAQSFEEVRWSRQLLHDCSLMSKLTLQMSGSCGNSAACGLWKNKSAELGRAARDSKSDFLPSCLTFNFALVDSFSRNDEGTINCIHHQYVFLSCSDCRILGEDFRLWLVWPYIWNVRVFSKVIFCVMYHYLPYYRLTLSNLHSRYLCYDCSQQQSFQTLVSFLWLLPLSLSILNF